jgi:hypothetical protein
MRRFAVVLLAAFIALIAPAAAATSPSAMRAADPEKGKTVVFGCDATPFADRVGGGGATRFRPRSGASAVRSQTFETMASPVTEPTTGTAFREVVVPVVLGFGSGWLPESCFHQPVLEATVTCASPIYTVLSERDGFQNAAASGYTVRPGEIVYPTETLGADADYDHVYTHRPGVDGLVPRRCLDEGVRTAQLARTHVRLPIRIVPKNSALAPH